jgi:hypothetical protein
VQVLSVIPTGEGFHPSLRIGPRGKPLGRPVPSAFAGSEQGFGERVPFSSGPSPILAHLFRQLWRGLEVTIHAKQVGSGWPTDFGCDSVFRWFRGGSTWLENLL